MARLEIFLLGSPKIKLDGELITGLPAKAQAMLFYLVVTRQQQTRERLAELLFSSEKMSRDKKLSNLRGPGALLALNEVLGEFIESPKFSVAFKTESDYWLDVDEFQACLRSPNPTVDELQTAVNLYQAEFLTGLRLRDADGFEEWAEQRRRALETQITTALYLLTVHNKEQQQYVVGISNITRLLAINPYFEEANRELMLLLALTKQINEACVHYENYERLLAEDDLEPEAETKALYQKIWRGELAQVEVSLTPLPAPPPQTWSPPFQAPPLLPHFVGRDKQLDEIISTLLAEGGGRIQALVGMGGVGKSTLAGEIAHALQEDFDDGVLWASVAVSEPTAVLESWAQAYGYDFSRLTDLESMANAFRGVLADKRVLLVLDDVVSVSRIRPLLPNGSGCRVLLTTRDQDLAYGLDARVWRLAELSPANGRRLLAHILGEKRIETEQEAAAEICDLLQNLPLALEIISQRLKSRPRRKLTDVAQRLRDERQRLSELKISDRAVRASFSISYDSLFAQEKQMFALMGVFHGRSFSADLLAPIAGQDRYETEDRLFALVALSLAQEDGANRYRQHPLLADFAREKLADTEDEGEVYGRLANTYLTFAQQHNHDYDSLRPEWENLMAAMEAAHEFELWQPVIDFADTLHDAWFARGRYTQARQGYQWASEAAARLGNVLGRSHSLLNWGEACIEQNDYEQATLLLLESANAAQEIQDLICLASTQYHLARIALDQGQYDEAKNLLAASQQLRVQLQDNVGVAATLFRQARVAHSESNYKQAEELGQQALSIQQTHADLLGSLRTLRLLTAIAITQKDVSLAENYCTQALQLCEVLQDQGELAAVLYQMGAIYRLRGEFTLARNTIEKCITHFRYMGDRRSLAQALYELSLIKEFINDYSGALDEANKSLALFKEFNDELSIAFVMLHLGDIFNHLSDPDQAKEIWEEGLEKAKYLNHTLLINSFMSRLIQEL